MNTIAWLGFVLGTLVVLILAVGLGRGFLAAPLGDFAAFHAAGVASREGLDPYDENVTARLNVAAVFPFLYPPHLIPPARWVSLLPYSAAAAAATAILVASLVYIYIAQSQLFALQARPAVSVLLFLGAATGATLGAFGSGNVSVPLYALLTLGLVLFARGRPLLLFAAIALAASIKFYYLGFLLLPLLVDWRRHVLPVAAVVAAVALVHALAWVLDPAAFQHFLAATSRRYATGDYGWGPLGLMLTAFDRAHKLTGIRVPHAAAYALFALYLAAAFLVFVRLAARLRAETDPGRRNYILGLLWVGMILCLPRLKGYDAVAAIVPLLALLWRGLLSQPRNIDLKWIVLPLLMVPLGHAWFGHLVVLTADHWGGLVLMGAWLLAWQALERGDVPRTA